MVKPTVLLVPGAWHSPSGFSALTRYLTRHGYTVEGISLASVGASQPQPNFDADVKAISSVIAEHADRGSDIVILFHSYGGIPGSSACKGLLKSDRQAAGKKGGIIHLIYCTAFAVEESVSLMDGLGGQPLPWFVFDAEERTMMPETPVETFYNDITDKTVLEGLVDSLQPQSYGAFWSKSTYAAWRDVDSTYVVTERDEALPPQAQRDMIAEVRQVLDKEGGKVSMQEVSMDTSHSPFVSRPEEVGKILRAIAGEEAQ